MVDLAYCLKNLLFFDISLLYYYINVKSSITFCLASGDIHFSLGISLSCSYVTISELFYCNAFETCVILSANLLPTKSQVASADFLITLSN